MVGHEPENVDAMLAVEGADDTRDVLRWDRDPVLVFVAERGAAQVMPCVHELTVVGQAGLDDETVLVPDPPAPR